MTKKEIKFRDPVVERVVDKFVERSDVGGKLIYEATFELTHSKYNPYAINVIKIARMHP